MKIKYPKARRIKKYPVVSVDIIIQDSKKRILLGKVSRKWAGSRRALWGLPGREVLFGESLKGCVERNLKEELNLIMISGKIVCVNSNFGYGNHYVSIGVLVKTKGILVNKRPNDWIEWRWFKKRHIPKKLFPSAERTLKTFHKKLVSLDFKK